MNSKKSKLFIALFLIVLLAASASALAMYVQNCKQVLREVDRYAQPFIIEVMEAIGTWQYPTIKPFLSEKYLALLTQEEWEKELQELSVLGDLRSFGRPRFVSHTPFTKYAVCESAIDVYSVAAEYEHANAVVRLHFNNSCGDLEVSTFIVTSAALKKKPEYLKDVPVDEKFELLDDESLKDEMSMEEYEESVNTLDDEISLEEIEQAPEATNRKPTKQHKPKWKDLRY